MTIPRRRPAITAEQAGLALLWWLWTTDTEPALAILGSRTTLEPHQTALEIKAVETFGVLFGCYDALRSTPDVAREVGQAFHGTFRLLQGDGPLGDGPGFRELGARLQRAMDERLPVLEREEPERFARFSAGARDHPSARAVREALPGYSSACGGPGPNLRKNLTRIGEHFAVRCGATQDAGVTFTGQALFDSAYHHARRYIAACDISPIDPNRRCLFPC